jgi:hypothetical protein
MFLRPALSDMSAKRREVVEYLAAADIEGPPPVMPTQPILHLVLLNLRSSAAPSKGDSDDAVRAILAAFGRLAEIDGVLHLGTAQAASEDSTHSLAMFALLRDTAALEEFGTHPRHIEYLQSAVLPQVSDLVTADVVAAGPPPPSYRAAACFCASFQPTTYDWQVRSLFDAGAQLPGHAIIGGPAVNGRQRFRAAGLALWQGPNDWSPGRRSDDLQRLWDNSWGAAATDQARVVGPAAPIAPKASEVLS